MAGLKIADPVTLTQALASTHILPGDTLMLMPGDYKGYYTTSIAGTLAAPIIIRPYYKNTVRINGSLTLNGAHVHIYDIDFYDDYTTRQSAIPGTSTSAGLTANITGFGLHGCTVRDLRASGLGWYSSGAGDVTENIFYNNGWKNPDTTGAGHDLYSNNNLGGRRTIARNMFSQSLGDYGLHIYSEGANALRDYTIDDNTIARTTHTGGGQGLRDHFMRDNIFYSGFAQLGRYSAAGTNQVATISGNTLIDLYAYTVYSWTDLTEVDNLVYGTIPANDPPKYTTTSKPATQVWLHPFTDSARWLGSVTIYNRDSAATVAVDFSSLLTSGTTYLLRNYQNIAETWEFDYTGGSVNVPTSWTFAALDGLAQTFTTSWPVFGALVIEEA